MKIALPAHLFPILVLALFFGLRLAAVEPASPAFQRLPFAEASAQAATGQKIVFIDFYTTWCRPCKMLDETTWQDPKVIELLQTKAVAVKIDAEKERDLASRYKIEAYPTLLLLKPDGMEIDRFVGYRNATKFIEEFTAGLAGKGSTARAQEAVSEAATDYAKVQARYNLGRTLATEGKSAEALAEYLWCYDEGMVQVRSFSGVRSSFLLSDIMRLAKSYPPARAALEERRDKLQAFLLTEQPSAQAALSFGALNRVLGENDKTLALFNQLPPGDPRRAALGTNILPLLLQARRYNEALTAQPYDQIVRMAGLMTAPRPGADKLPAEALAAQRKSQVEWFADHLEILAGAGDLDHARELLGKAQSYDTSESANATYREHLTRAGHAELLPPPAAASIDTSQPDKKPDEKA